VAKLNERLSQVGFQDRLHFCSVAPRRGDGFDKELGQFSQRIRELSQGERK
jgi:hypothetical protein